MTNPQAADDANARLEAASVWCLRISEGALPDRERREFEAWIAEDPDNQRAFEDAVGVWRAVRDTGATAELLGMRREALASFENASRKRWSARRPRLGLIVSAAAATILMVLVSSLTWPWLTTTTYRTGTGERRVVVLSDGSKVSLDAATEVAVRYVRDARTLKLSRGRAKFDVAKDRDRPFTVAAADKLVRATGTAFSVELLQGQVQVVLYEGHVDVIENRSPGPGPAEHVRLAPTSVPASAPALEADQVLTPGRELDVSIEQAVGQVESVDPVRSLAWEGGQLVFIGEPLASAVERINRYSDRKVHVREVDAANMRIDGVFSAGDTDAFIEGITGIYHLRVQETADGTVFLTRR